MTASGGAAAEAPRLFRFLAARNRALGRTTSAARIPTSRAEDDRTARRDPADRGVGRDPGHLVGYLSRALRDAAASRLVSTLRMRTPGLARALADRGPEVTVSWNAIPGTEAG